MDQNKLNELNSKLDNRSEKLDEYIHVAGVRVWIVLIAVLTLLAGVVCWGFLGRLETKVSSLLNVTSKGEKYCLVKSKDIDKIKPGMPVESESTEGSVVDIGDYDQSADSYLVKVDIDMDTGMYISDIVIDNVSPISLLFE